MGISRGECFRKLTLVSRIASNPQQEPDIPGIPAGNDDDGTNYLAFLVVLKNLLPGKTISIAAPASYWYLKAFPIDKISKVVDYIVFMTYDLHGQWDANNQFSQEGCSTGMCLRSHVNLTETKTALAMVSTLDQFSLTSFNT